MMDTAELVLSFFPDPGYAAKAEGAFRALGISHRAVAPGEVTQTIGYLAGLPGQCPSPKPLVLPVPAQPMMVLCALSRERMDLLFNTMRAHGAPPPDRKAILTPTNMGWTLSALYDELGREHRAMHGGKGGK